MGGEEGEASAEREDGEDLLERVASSSSSSSSGTSSMMTSVSSSILPSVAGTGRTAMDLGPAGASTLGMAAGTRASKVADNAGVAAGCPVEEMTKRSLFGFGN